LAISRPVSYYTSETTKAGTWLLWKATRLSGVIFQMVPFQVVPTIFTETTKFRIFIVVSIFTTSEAISNLAHRLITAGHSMRETNHPQRQHDQNHSRSFFVNFGPISWKPGLMRSYLDIWISSQFSQLGQLSNSR